MKIVSRADSDLYKFTMQQIVLHQFSSAIVEYEFRCRNKDVDLSPYVNEIRDVIEQYCSLKFTRRELLWFSERRYFKSDYIDFLRIFQSDSQYVNVGVDDGGFYCKIKGPWLYTIDLETPCLAIINEIYFDHNATEEDKKLDIARQRLQKKLELVMSSTIPITFIDFGTRRRFSFDWHEEVISTCKQYASNSFVGTSNPYFAMNYDIMAAGTHAHEYFEACQAFVRLADSQKYALECWSKEYRGDLGIALSDTYGMKAFLKDFDLYFSKLFDGARHDSGDPKEWVDLLINHYKNFRIDPMTKSAVFSDGLNFELVKELAKYCHGRIKYSFGIGTNLTNDVCETLKPLNIVIKMVRCNGQAVAKVSNAPGKTICLDQSQLDYIKKVFNIK